MELRAERELVARACRILGGLDLTRENTGHVSVRTSGDRVLIRARGPREEGVRYTTAEQVIAIDLAGKAQGGGAEGLEPPIETALHTAIYRARPDVRAIAHVHPPSVVLMTICDRPLEALYGAYDPTSARLAIAGIPTYDRSVLIATDALGGAVASSLGSKSACLLRGHGLVTAASSVEEATVVAIKVNELAEMNVRAALLGGGRPIGEADRAAFAEGGGGNGGAARLQALWRYYARLADGGDRLAP